MLTPEPSPSATPVDRAPELTYVVGHRNPDADSICSAIAYASYKTIRGIPNHVAARCGNTNARIDAILARFQQPLPVYLSDVSPRVRDLMVADPVAVTAHSTCAEALELIDRHDIRLLPVTDASRRVVGTISLPHLGGIFIPRVSEPRLMRQVNTSLANIARALNGRILHVVSPARIEELFVRLGTMDIRSFWTISERDNIPADQAIIIVGDRTDIQTRAIEIGVRAIVVTSNLPIDDQVVAMAREKGVGLIVSPYDSATTAWVVRTASTIERVVDTRFASLSPDTRISEVRRRVQTLNAPAYVVVDDAGILLGVLSKGDILKPARTRLILVDHNEMTQAVPGAEEVIVTEIIDHHRLGAPATQQPILFINEPVGSTCTIIADLFRRELLTPDANLAGIMMSGIISDTLNLQSPTSTEKDEIVLGWLSNMAGVEPGRLAELIFSSGSVILASAPEKVVRSDHKIYEEDSIRFSVSQVEELGFGNFWNRAREISAALQGLRDEERVFFACLLVTDINTQNSLLLVKGDAEFIRRISFPHVEQDEIFDLPGIVSRKKQLIPYLSTIIREMGAEGLRPKQSTAPFPRKTAAAG